MLYALKLNFSLQHIGVLGALTKKGLKEGLNSKSCILTGKSVIY